MKIIKIGRSPSNDCVYYDNSVSRTHAVLELDASGIQGIISDLNSMNGTFVNDVKVVGSMSVCIDDSIRIGTVQTSIKEILVKANDPGLSVQHFEIKPQKQVYSNRTIIGVVSAVVAVLILVAGGYWFTHRTWSKEKIYKQYHDAVCWVYVQYGYRIFVDDRDFTPTLCQLLEIAPSDIVHIEGDNLISGPIAAQGTAFFISNDGKLATNLHITRPWLFSDEINNLETIVNKILAILAVTHDPTLSRAKVKVEGVMGQMFVILDGLPISEGNAIRVMEIKGHDDTNKDVAIMQTENRELPTRVKNIIDIRKADISENCLTEGKNIYTIGFPLGADIAMTSNQELKNQVHGGSITQNKGDYAFGHDAESANGASGSPIFNDKGKLIGVLNAGVPGTQGFNYAIKIKYLLELLD